MYVIYSDMGYLYGRDVYSDEYIFGNKKRKAIRYDSIEEAAEVVDYYLPRGNYYSIERA